MEEEIKVFFDSNVLFSIAYTGREKSRSCLLYELQSPGKIKVYLSTLVCEESAYNIRLKKPQNLSFLDDLIRQSHQLRDIYPGEDEEATVLESVQRLPLNDRIILTTAVANGMDFFLTGNSRDFKGSYRRKIVRTLILKPADFLYRRF